MGKSKKYLTPSGVNVSVCFNELNQTWVALQCVGPLRYKIYEEPTEEGIYEKLKDYHGFDDVVAPAYLRGMFSKYIDRTYPFDVASAAILEFEDLEENIKDIIATEIISFVKAMNRLFNHPYLEDTYYPYGVEVSVQQLTDYKNNIKNGKTE